MLGMQNPDSRDFENFWFDMNFRIWPSLKNWKKWKMKKEMKNGNIGIRPFLMFCFFIYNPAYAWNRSQGSNPENVERIIQ